MRNYASSITKAENGYKVFYRYKAPDGTVKSSCKRGFKLKKDARDWQETELPKIIMQLQHEETLDENLTMSELIDEYMEFTKLRRRSSTAENKENIIVRPNIRIQMYLEKYLVEILSELKRLEKIPTNIDVLDNLTYLVNFISKLSPAEKENEL